MISTDRASGNLHADARPALHMLTLTPFYPTRRDDANGCFVAEPLTWVKQLGVANSVFGVQPLYRGHAGGANSGVSARWTRFFLLPGGFGLPTAGAFLFASIVGKVRDLHRSHPIDVIHAHAALPCGRAAALLARELGIPFVVTVHGLDAFSTNQVEGYAGQWCQRMSRMVYRSARNEICISEKVRDQVNSGAGVRVNTSIVYNGVDPEIFSPAPDSEPAAILSIGNMIQVKGHELLLRAAAGIRDQFPQMRCDIIGDGPERARLSALASEFNIAANVGFIGRQTRSQVTDAVRRCTLFALPSRYEGLGCVYLEAMSA